MYNLGTIQGSILDVEGTLTTKITADNPVTQYFSTQSLKHETFNHILEEIYQQSKLGLEYSIDIGTYYQVAPI